MRAFSLIALAAPLVSAIQFTAPELNATISKGEKYTLTWDTVDTDPSSFSVFLVNFVDWPPSYTALATDLETAAGSAEVTVPCSTPSSYGFQFNAINGTNVYVIYAQTEKFFVDGGPCEDAPVPSPSTCAPPATVTVTVSTTLSHSLYSNHSATTSAPSSLYPTIIPSAGKCPDTIGWGESGYHNPVTLTSVPHPEYPVATVYPPATTSAPAYKAKGDGKKYGVTSTIYQTVYKDLSEVEDGECFC
ncbi:extracellular proline-serine rich protein [Rhypophila decipiens]|uniref:Extracellular proline-serine rich protein n=1 Tax=Rhypophila decipiens TaxID=261697 RepID=A0AAN6XZX0_9PEZI|nr:extracellular proline-serine rich protein [Rhypophila decipiens]